MKIFSDDVGELLERQVAERGECVVGDGDVGGMIEGGPVGGLTERKAVEGWGGCFDGGVGFDEQAVGRNLGKQRGTGASTRGEEFEVEREVSAEVREGRNEFNGSGVAVHKESAGG